MTRRLAVVAGMFGFLSIGLFAQDVGKKEVEQPLKKAMPPGPIDVAKTVAVEQPLLESAKSPPPDKFDLAKTGILWHRGIESALNQGRPILLLQILGNYDDVYC